MHRAYKNRSLSARQKLANRLISKKTLYCRTVFRHNQTPIRNETRQLLRCGKSQRPSGAEKYLHESKKSNKQNFSRSAVKGSNPSKYCIRGEFLLKKGKNRTFYQHEVQQMPLGNFSLRLQQNFRDCAEVFTMEN